MRRRSPSPTLPAIQRGAAALGVAMVLLLAMTAVAFFANRALLFEQRASANQYRSARAFEAAEAGLEWATARLNDPRAIDAACRPTAGAAQSFRSRYAPLAAGPGFAPATAARPGCSLGDASLVCRCPAEAAAPDLRDDAPTFTIELAAVAGDPESLQVVSRGCSGPGAQCIPGSDRGAADAAATVQATLKLRPALRALPVAAVTAGGAARLGSGLRLVNTDPPTQGYVVHAGGAVELDHPANVTTLPGSPTATAVVARDGHLARLASFDPDGAAFFSAWFGSTPAQFAVAPTTHGIAACRGASCAVAIQAARAEGHDSFLVQGDLLLDASGWPEGSIGTAGRPIVLVVEGNLTFEGDVPFHGLAYVAAADWTAAIDAQVHGALIARGRIAGSGTGRVRYDPEVLARLRMNAGVLTRLPGSWQDGRCASDDPAQACAAAH